PIKKDKMFLYGTYERFSHSLSRSSTSIVPGTFARQGLLWPGNSLGLPAGTPGPRFKNGMLKYVQYFLPGATTPDRPDGSAIAYANPVETLPENFGLARYDYVISTKDSFSGNLTMDYGSRSVPWGGGGGGDPNFVSLSELHARTLSLKETHVFSPTLV